MVLSERAAALHFKRQMQKRLHLHLSFRNTSSQLIEVVRERCVKMQVCSAIQQFGNSEPPLCCA